MKFPKLLRIWTRQKNYPPSYSKCQWLKKKELNPNLLFSFKRYICFIYNTALRLYATQSVLQLPWGTLLFVNVGFPAWRNIYLWWHLCLLVVAFAVELVFGPVEEKGKETKLNLTFWQWSRGFLLLLLLASTYSKNTKHNWSCSLVLYPWQAFLLI